MVKKTKKFDCLLCTEDDGYILDAESKDRKVKYWKCVGCGHTFREKL